MTLLSHPHASRWIYGGLALGWMLVVAWQGVEHARVEKLARQNLLSRARDISNTIAVISRSSVPGFIRQSRLEHALKELCEGSELISVALLNSSGETIVAAGKPLKLSARATVQEGELWGKHSVTIINPVDFGSLSDDDGTTRPTIVMPSRDEGEERSESEKRDEREKHDQREGRPLPPFAEPHRGDGPPPPDGFFGHPGQPGQGSPSAVPSFAEPAPPEGPGRPAAEAREGRGGREGRGEGPRGDSARRIFRRPPWMDQQRYEELLVKRGLHGFILVLNNANMRSELRRDAWLRFVLSSVALVAAAGLGLAWRGIGRATQLQLRLLRAQELNEHLRELNLAAAGLAHETRNPLNIVRGLAQMIARHDPLPPAIQLHARQITDEVDQVTHRLNEFIKYSRPTQPRLAPSALHTVVAEVNATLAFDREDKRILCTLDTPPLTIEADESQLRQVLFNLMLNAIQAVPPGGEIRVACAEAGGGEAVLIVEDNGPGVPPERRDDIFQPYFTTHEEGSGLGLAVVRQIVLAHHWEIEVGQSEMGGARFRVLGIKLAQVPR